MTLAKRNGPNASKLMCLILYGEHPTAIEWRADLKVSMRLGAVAKILNTRSYYLKPQLEKMNALGWITGLQLSFNKAEFQIAIPQNIVRNIISG